MKKDFFVDTKYGKVKFDSFEEFFVGENKIIAKFFTEPFYDLTAYCMVLMCGETEKRYKTTQKEAIQDMARMLYQIKNGKIKIKDL